MIGDHHGRTARRATLLVRAVDDILGTHNLDELRPRLATTEERRLLSLPQVSVVLELARTAHDTDRKPVLVLHQVRRGDGATFSYQTGYAGR